MIRWANFTYTVKKSRDGVEQIISSYERPPEQGLYFVEAMSQSASLICNNFEKYPVIRARMPVKSTVSGSSSRYRGLQASKG